MRYRRGWRMLMVAAVVAGLPGVGAAGTWTAPAPTDKVEAGVNWTTHFFQATAIGMAPPTALNPQHGRALAIEAGTILARKELLAIAQGVTIDSQSRVQALMIASTVTDARVSGIVRGAQVVDVRDLGGGTVEVTVAVAATGPFADLVLPPPAAAGAPGPGRTPPAPGPGPQAPPMPTAAPVVYSGLVIDARGLGLKPAMAPKVVSESGQEIYGSAVVDREWAIEQGMVGYAKDLFAAQASPRVGEKPLVVKGLRTTGANGCDVVLSNADAALLLAASGNLSFLEKAKVMVVVD